MDGKTIRKVLWVLFLVLSVGLFSSLGCGEEQVSGEGIVEFVEVEGGCWRIAGSDGVNYEPLNLRDEFKENGLKVWFEATIRKNMNSTCMVGLLVDIKNIHRLETED